MRISFVCCRRQITSSTGHDCDKQYCSSALIQWYSSYDVILYYMPRNFLGAKMAYIYVFIRMSLTAIGLALLIDVYIGAP